MELEIDDMHVSAAAAITGLTPEFLGTDSPQQFFAELIKHGYDSKGFFDEVTTIVSEWQQQHKRQQEVANLQITKAGVVLGILNALPEPSNAFNGAEDEAMLSAYKAELRKAIKENLDEDSIWEFVRLAGKMAISLQNKGNALKRHAENHALKQTAFSWCDANMAKFKSMDSAAEAIAGKLVPVTFRTARDWIGEWKKLRSTGRP